MRLIDFIQTLSKLLIKVARELATWHLNDGLKETEKENIWMAVEKMRKEKRKFERKRKRYKL